MIPAFSNLVLTHNALLTRAFCCSSIFIGYNGCHNIGNANIRMQEFLPPLGIATWTEKTANTAKFGITESRYLEGYALEQIMF